MSKRWQPIASRAWIWSLARRRGVEMTWYSSRIAATLSRRAACWSASCRLVASVSSLALANDWARLRFSAASRSERASVR